MIRGVIYGVISILLLPGVQFCDWIRVFDKLGVTNSIVLQLQEFDPDKRQSNYFTFNGHTRACFRSSQCDGTRPACARARIHALVNPTQLTSAVGCSEDQAARALQNKPEQSRSMCTLCAFQAEIWILFRSRTCACRSCKTSQSIRTKGGCTFPFVTIQLLTLLLTQIARHKQETYLVPGIKGRLKLLRGLLCWSGARIQAEELCMRVSESKARSSCQDGRDSGRFTCRKTRTRAPTHTHTHLTVRNLKLLQKAGNHDAATHLPLTHGRTYRSFGSNHDAARGTN